MSSSYVSSAGSSGHTPSTRGPLCHCAQPTVLCISWSDDNPGRRFYKCDAHGFVVWYDKAPSCLWQKQSLIEARDKIRVLTQDIKALRDALIQANSELSALQLSRSSVPESDLVTSIKNLFKKHNYESEKRFRRVVVSSWGGFVLAAAVMVYMIKK